MKLLKKAIIANAIILSLGATATVANAVQGEYPHGKNARVGSASATSAARSVTDKRDPFSDGARAVIDARDIYSGGAGSVLERRDPFTDGA
ncbi:hypothetical protein [Cupriavidus sp. CP313]